MTQTVALQRVHDELRLPHHARPVGARRTPSRPRTTTSTPGSSWRSSWSAAASTRCSSPTWSASTTATAAGAETAVREGLQIPVNDPSAADPGDGVRDRAPRLRLHPARSCRSHPFNFARRMSTLDHLTKGRVGWNIVTSYLPNAAAQPRLRRPDPARRALRRADEYLDVVYKLWEGSWEDDAVRRRPGRQASTPTRPRSTRSTTSASTTDVVGPAPVRALAAAHPAAVPGRLVRAAAASSPPATPRRSSSARRRARTGAAAQIADIRARAVRQRPPAAGHPVLPGPDLHRRQHRGRGAGARWPSTRSTSASRVSPRT